MIIQNSKKLLTELSSIEEQISGLKELIQGNVSENQMEEILIQILNSYVKSS
jgi:DNA-binding FrmR family transcriptional regulator